jgi:hypothetical protein
MKRFIEGADRGQSTLLPECLDDFIDDGNPVRVIDAFVDVLDLGKLGFKGVVPEATGRPSYHPSALLKLYIYGKLAAYEKQMLASPDQQISLTDPDSRSMATSGRGSGVVGYNVQVAVDTEHHLIVTHEVTNVGNDTSQLTHIGKQAKAVLEADKLEVVADRGYFNGEELLACEQADIEVTLPKPLRSGAKARGRFGKQDFVYLAEEDVYRCPAGEHLKYYFTAMENGLAMRRYWTNACRKCAIKDQCTTGKERRITRWEHEHVVEAAQRRLDANPQAMRQRRETVEHPFGTMKARMGATHFLTKTLPKVATEMALSVLAYNLTRVMNIVGVKPLIAAMGA